MHPYFLSIISYLTLAYIGFANALPIPLGGTTLSIWLIESNFDKKLIGLYALTSLPFSLKILWMPVIDRISPPFFKGRERKGWILFALFGIILTFLAFSFIEPSKHPILLALNLSILSSLTGCLYITGLAYELESLDEHQYALGSAHVLAGYRIGLLCAGGGALYFSFFWNWAWMFRFLALILSLGTLFIILLPEPFKSKKTIELKRDKYNKHPSFFKGFWHEIVLEPCRSFFKKSDWQTILCCVFFFKIGDELIKSMVGPFYLSLGFNKTELANAAKIWGMGATILGAFTSGFFFKNSNPYTSLSKMSLIHSFSLGCYWFLSVTGNSLMTLYFTVAIENFTLGMAMTVFISFIWKICDRHYAAIQYALIWSLFSFKAHIFNFLGSLLAFYSSWQTFFFIIMILSIFSSIIPWFIIKKRSFIRFSSIKS